ncbi:hypothetical protein H4582DRAFT_2130537 [Lactarius indigo]|nr:hypothetical protein H4582DRAFT_2130537 [Lactarius indigo]
MAHLYTERHTQGMLSKESTSQASLKHMWREPLLRAPLCADRRAKAARNPSGSAPPPSRNRFCANGCAQKMRPGEHARKG